MVLRPLILALAAVTLASAALTIDCARMCLMGGFAMHMDCWLAARTGIPCDKGMLIGLVLATMIGSATTGFLWSLKMAQAR